MNKNRYIYCKSTNYNYIFDRKSNRQMDMFNIIDTLNKQNLKVKKLSKQIKSLNIKWQKLKNYLEQNLEYTSKLCKEAIVGTEHYIIVLKELKNKKLVEDE